MKKIFLLLFLFLIFLSGCVSYEFGSKDLKEYEVEFIFINAGEEYRLDIHKQFENDNINISKYELISIDNDIATIKGEKIVGKNTGKTDIYATLYEKSSKEKYFKKVATIYVVNIQNLNEIKTIEDIQNIKEDGHYILKNDIDLSSINAWRPIEVFSGVFINPDGYKIQNLSVPSRESLLDYNGCNMGLFKLLKNAYIDGLILENVSIDVTDYNYDIAFVGGIASTIHYGVIRNCKVKGTLKSKHYAGGIVAMNTVGYILDCTFEGEIHTIGKEAKAGGITGSSLTTKKSGGKIENCNVNATVTSDHTAGGIVGALHEEENIFNSTFTGTVDGKVHQGNIIGIKN